MTYRMLVLDLDGTLTNHKKEITPRTLQALRQAQSQGTILVLASGRPTRGIAPLADLLELDKYNGYVLSFNGGQIIDWKTRTPIYAQTLDDALLPRLYARAKHYGLPIVTYDDHSIICETEDDPYLQEEVRINQMPIRRVEHFLTAIQHLEGRLTKCLMTGTPDSLVYVERAMRQEFEQEMEIFRSAPFFLELMPKGIDKAQSLARLLKHLTLTPAECIACGDGYNDLSMIRFAGLGVAMANAEEEVRAAADFITTSNEEDGIAVVVERFLLSSNPSVMG